MPYQAFYNNGTLTTTSAHNRTIPDPKSVYSFPNSLSGSTQFEANFTFGELKCKGSSCASSGNSLIDYRLVDLLQKIRNSFGAAVTVKNSFRCTSHNTGVEDSQHLYGRAADITVSGKTARQVYDTLNSWDDVRGLILYNTGNYCHVDVRAGTKLRKEDGD